MVEKISSFLLCPKTGINKANFELNVPEDVIQGSARSLFSVTGDIMGSSASNLENLIVLPTGCGEQNMAKFSSNLAVLDYLKSTNRLDSNTESRIRSNLNKGYQNELTFRGRDGSYSVWGGSWGQPSSFLTAMVYQGFKRAHKFIFIDDDGLTSTYNYLLSTQDRVTGCFNKIGSIYSWALRVSFRQETNCCNTPETLAGRGGGMGDARRHWISPRPERSLNLKELFPVDVGELRRNQRLVLSLRSCGSAWFSDE